MTKYLKMLRQEHGRYKCLFRFLCIFKISYKGIRTYSGLLKYLLLFAISEVIAVLNF